MHFRDRYTPAKICCESSGKAYTAYFLQGNTAGAAPGLLLLLLVVEVVVLLLLRIGPLNRIPQGAILIISSGIRFRRHSTMQIHKR